MATAIMLVSALALTSCNDDDNNTQAEETMTEKAQVAAQALCDCWGAAVGEEAQMACLGGLMAQYMADIQDAEFYAAFGAAIEECENDLDWGIILCVALDQCEE